MPERKTPRIPRHLSAAMTIADLERWFESEFKKIRKRQIAIEQQATALKKNDGITGMEQ
ncbi:hypothetical protein ACVMH6_007006 [Rhizobium leguminosarum]